MLLLIGVAKTASAQVGGGLNVQYGFEFEEVQLGAELHIVPGGLPNFTFVPNFEVYLRDDPSVVAFNGDFHYAPTVSRSREWRPYIGLGLALVRVAHRRNSNTEAGVNLKGGLNFRGQRTTPFVQIEYRVADDPYDDLSLGGGIRFIL